MSDPEFRRVGNFGLKKMDLASATVGFQVTYYNPNSFGVTVKEALVDVYLDSAYLGKFKQDSTVQVKKTSEFTIPFSGEVSLKTVLNLNLNDLEREVLVKADGTVKAGKAGIFISKPIHYEGRHKLELRQ